MGDRICQLKLCILNCWKSFLWSLCLILQNYSAWSQGGKTFQTRDSTAPSFTLTLTVSFFLSLYPHRFAAAFGTWVSVSISISTSDYDDILLWPLSKTIQLKNRHETDPLNAWTQTIESKGFISPSSTDFTAIPIVWCPHFFPHKKLFNDTVVCLLNETMFIVGIDPTIPTANQSSLPFPVPKRPTDIFGTLSMVLIVALTITLNSAFAKFRKWHKKRY